MTRYALYYTPPPDSPLDVFGARWFALAEVAALTAQPRLYGFHATLKAPFRLAAGRDEAALFTALADFCAGTARVDVGRLALADLDGFLALVPERQDAALERLAGDCVEFFDGFRAPAGDAELAKRRAGGLSARQEANLSRWGYPFVGEDFRFHMTLTRRLAASETSAARAALAPLVASALSRPLTLDALSLSVQPGEAAPFEVRRRLALAG